MRGKIFENVTMLTKMILPNFIGPGMVCIDATTGNGHDTEFLADLVGPEGYVYGFDIQEEAIKSTKMRLSNRQNVDLICDGHQHMEEYVDRPVDFIIFNLGYLPKFDKTIKTRKTTTLQAIEASLRLLKVNGILWVVVYPGHDEGAEESHALIEYFATLPQKSYSVLKSAFVNQRNNPPYVFAIEKKSG